MYRHLLSVINFVCILYAGLCSEDCSVLAKRETNSVPAGGSLFLSCDVEHCGDSWTGSWMWGNFTDGKFSPVKESTRHHLKKVALSVNTTRLVLEIQSVKQSDEGSYKCSVDGSNDATVHGHITNLNVTAAVLTQRHSWLRAVVCCGAFLCTSIILGLARCLSPAVRPHPLPRRKSANAAVCRDEPVHSSPQPPPRCPVPQKYSPPKKAPPKPSQKPEVVYVDISQEVLSQQRAPREPAESATVYSSLRF
ncbi:uncharacterized protein KZ484_022601 [Pholidichthys leucotaenia]